MRLTRRDITGLPYCPEVGYAEILRKLAAYEDTGLTPEAVKGLQESLIGAISAEIAEEQGYVEANRAKEIACAEVERRLVILPCDVGDTVYRIHTKDHIVKNRIIAFHVSVSGIWYWDETGRETPVETIGKTVFLTRAEAEAALKGEKREDV